MLWVRFPSVSWCIRNHHKWQSCVGSMWRVGVLMLLSPLPIVLAITRKPYRKWRKNTRNQTQICKYILILNYDLLRINEEAKQNVAELLCFNIPSPSCWIPITQSAFFSTNMASSIYNVYSNYPKRQTRKCKQILILILWVVKNQPGS